MICSSCGSSLDVSQRYCPSCGAKTVRGSRPTSTQTSKVQSVPPVGRAKFKWWGNLPSIAKGSHIPADYAWLNHELTITVYANHLIVTPGAENRSSVADFATSGAIPLLTLVAGAVRGAKDSLTTALGTPTDQEHEEAFVSHALLWCETQKAQVWEYRQRRFLGMKTPSMFALRCDLNTLSGKIPFLIPLLRAQEAMRDPIKAIGCPLVVKATDIRDKDMHGIFNDALRAFYTEKWVQGIFD